MSSTNFPPAPIVDLMALVNVFQTTNQILTSLLRSLNRLGPTAGDTHVRMQLQWSIGATVADGTAWFCFDPPYNGIINTLIYFTGSDSFNVDVDIAGAPVTGLAGVSVNSSIPSIAVASGANTFDAGQPITVTISGTSGTPTDALLSLSVDWTD